MMIATRPSLIFPHTVIITYASHLSIAEIYQYLILLSYSFRGFVYEDKLYAHDKF